MGELGLYLAVGAVVGFFAGLLGIGGGIVIVSTLALLFTAKGVAPAVVMHLAIGTSLLAIMAGSWSSFRAHHRRGAVDWPLARAMMPGLMAGVLAGAFVAPHVPGAFLKYFFLAFMALLTAQMAFDLRPAGGRPVPGKAALALAGAGIGTVSSLFGGGAAAIGVPFLTWHSVDTHRAIGTCAAMGFAIAIAGSAGYMVAGRGAAGLPQWSVGFVYLPAAAGIALASVVAAPAGVRLAHRLRGATLKRIFAVFLVVMGVKVAISV